MNLLSIDIELNQLNDKPKVIEIGAVAFKSHTGEIIETFQTYINPQEEITPFITDLTKITNENVANAPLISEGYRLLKDFHHKHRCPRNPIVWGSGVRNDSNTIWLESGVEEDNFMGFRVIDAKTLYQSYKMHTNGKLKNGLKASCESLGIGWDGKYGESHGALADSHNTARIWFYLISKMANGFKIDPNKIR